MIKRVLVGLGGTPFTPTAIRYAVELTDTRSRSNTWQALYSSNCYSTRLTGKQFNCHRKQHQAPLAEGSFALPGHPLYPPRTALDDP